MENNKKEEKIDSVPEIEMETPNEEMNKEESSSQMEQRLEQKTKEADEIKDLLQRTAAEFDNYKKRTIKERQSLYNSVVSDIMCDILPVIDNLENAIQSCGSGEQGKITEGLELILRQFKNVLTKYQVSEIEALGQQFDPEYHEAVMHIEDENCGENEIVEVLRKGYMCGDKVARYSMVKVAN
jgi:molecular chaperone GrpE